MGKSRQERENLLREIRENPEHWPGWQDKLPELTVDNIEEKLHEWYMNNPTTMSLNLRTGKIRPYKEAYQRKVFLEQIQQLQEYGIAQAAAMLQTADRTQISMERTVSINKRTIAAIIQAAKDAEQQVEETGLSPAMQKQVYSQAALAYEMTIKALLAQLDANNTRYTEYIARPPELPEPRVVERVIREITPLPPPKKSLWEQLSPGWQLYLILCSIVVVGATLFDGSTGFMVSAFWCAIFAVLGWVKNSN